MALEIIREVESDAKQQVQQQQARFQPNVLEQWLFNGQAKFSTARKNLEKKLDAKLTVINRLCELTGEQKSTLHLAGSGDIHRFMRECEKMQRQFKELDPVQMNNLWQDIQPLRTKFNSTLFGNESMFDRVQKNALGKDQFETLERRRREALQFAVETAIQQVVSQFDSISPLKRESRTALTKLLMETVPLPLALETTEQRQMAQHYVLYSCSKRPPDELESLLDEESWEIFKQSMQNCRGYSAHFQSIGMIKE